MEVAKETGGHGGLPGCMTDMTKIVSCSSHTGLRDGQVLKHKQMIWELHHVRQRENIPDILGGEERAGRRAHDCTQALK